MKTVQRLFLAVAILSAAGTAGLAQNSQGQNGNNQGQNQNGGYHGAPGPVVAAGLPGLAFGVGYGIYWLRTRRRKRTES
jgi:hypothetical protein